jgi:hypothetical protein
MRLGRWTARTLPRLGFSAHAARVGAADFERGIF